jgi:N-acetylmuramoyl-L-alanine amidase
MASIAAEHQFFWETLWNLPENAELKRTRNDPYVLLPGDRVFVPELRSKELPCATDKRHTFVRKGVWERLRIVFTDEDDRPVANQPYVLEIDRRWRFEGETDGGGAIEQPIPPNAWQGRLVVGTGEDQREYFVNLGRVDPSEEISGAQARLLNLGYYDGPVDGCLNAQTTSALLLFQDKYQLTPSGENDGPTQAKLKELFGC